MLAGTERALEAPEHDERVNMLTTHLLLYTEPLVGINLCFVWSEAAHDVITSSIFRPMSFTWRVEFNVLVLFGGKMEEVSSGFGCLWLKKGQMLDVFLRYEDGLTPGIFVITKRVSIRTVSSHLPIGVPQQYLKGHDSETISKHQQKTGIRYVFSGDMFCKKGIQNR